MSSISAIQGREVLDSRGNPTVEVDVLLQDGSLGRAIVPSGASVGSFEAVERRDGDRERYIGKGVLDAVTSVNTEIAQALKGRNALQQEEVDRELIRLDGTPNKSRLGANAILGTSLAVLDAAAQAQHTPLYRHVNSLFDTVEMSMPVPMINVLNGGEHADNNLHFQEFMIVPVGGGSFREAVRIGVEIFQTLKINLQSANPPKATTVGDEGGFAPNLESHAEALNYLTGAIESAGHSLQTDCLLALDCAATEFWNDGCYEVEEGLTLNGEQFVGHLEQLVGQFPQIVSIEDGCAEEDWENWQLLQQGIGHSVQLVGDDIFVTDRSRLLKGIDSQAANAILIKLNQVGTVSETLEVMRLAKSHGFNTIVSHRSGDTEDTKIADIAVATGAGQIKCGSFSRSERVAKYNRLLRIEEECPELTFRGLKEFTQFRTS